MSQRQTTVAERNRMVDLKLAGDSLPEIAEQTGWSFECVRKWWRRFRDGGRGALGPSDQGDRQGGPMSTFPDGVRFAFLRIKKEHPGWGAAVARPRVARRLQVAEADLPCVSTIEKYWASFGDRLYQRHRRRRPPLKRERGAKPSHPHERWQADFKEWVSVEGLGKIDVLNIRDEATPVKIGSFVYPARKVTGRDVQHAFRQAFSRWGLCDRVQTDQDKRLVNPNHTHPFPTPFTLWLIGLGIAHDLAPSAPDNGCTERFNRTWYERVVLGRRVHTLEQLQQISDEELYWMNHKLPSNGRACAGRPPLVAYPQALQPRRAYARQQELEYFSLQRVFDYLATQFWWRRVNSVGQISLGGHRYGLSTDHTDQDVRITFDAQQGHFIVQDEQQQLIKVLEPKSLTVTHITGLEAHDH